MVKYVYGFVVERMSDGVKLIECMLFGKLGGFKIVRRL